MTRATAMRSGSRNPKYLLQLDLYVGRTLRRTASCGGLGRPGHGVAFDGHAVGVFHGAEEGSYPVGLDYWIWPGWHGGLGSSLSDLFGPLPGRALSARLPDGANPAPGVQGFRAAGAPARERGAAPPDQPVGAENLRHLGRCSEDHGRLSHAFRRWAGRSWSVRRCDDLRLVGLKLTFLIVSRAMSLLRLSRREAWWKDAEILMLRHQLAVAQRERPRAQSRLTWPDRAWLALLAETLPIERLAGLRLIVTPATILRLCVPRISSAAVTSRVALLAVWS